MSDVRDYVEGWACPGQAKVQHYFVNSLSLCHSWSFSGDVDETPEAYLKQCVRCARAVKGTIRAMPAAPVPTPQPACARCHGSGVVKLRSNGVLTGTAYCPVCCTADGRIKQSAPQPAPTVSMCPTCKRPQVDHGRAHDITDADALPLCFAAVGSAGARRECREFAGRAPTVSQGDAESIIRDWSGVHERGMSCCDAIAKAVHEATAAVRVDLTRVTAEQGTTAASLAMATANWIEMSSEVLRLKAERDALTVKLGEAVDWIRLVVRSPKTFNPQALEAFIQRIDDAGTAAKGTP